MPGEVGRGCAGSMDTTRHRSTLSCRQENSREEEPEMSMSVGVLDHYNVSTRKLGDTIRFYEDVLGFVNGPRPPFDFPGAWLYSEGHAVLHVNDISPTDRPQLPDSGVIDHVAFGSRGFERMKQHLTKKGVPFRINQVPNSVRWQIFVQDPNNVMIELNFDVSNETPAR
jgi:catechol 2,3-dioxygenase-like lactoylglutathione lyase family enzyme